jgi:uncharacterized membrane protein YqhA
MLILPVIGCVLLTAYVVIMGSVRIVVSGAEWLSKGDFTAKASKTLALQVIEVIDLFLVGTVAYITAIGIYKLFISDSDIKLPIRITINTLSDLENKIIGVIVAALAVAFLGRAAAEIEPTKLLNYGGGIAVVIAALAFFIKVTSGGKNVKKKKTE